MGDESSLHLAIKDFLTDPADKQEVKICDFWVDIVKPDKLVEVQTGNFSALKSKLQALLDKYPVQVVYPIPVIKWIIKLPAHGDEVIQRRKSPKRGRVEDLFNQLVFITSYVSHCIVI